MVHVHDPHMIYSDGWYYVFSTGPGIPIRRSKDLVHWTFLGQVFKDPVPAWTKDEIPNASSIWAPDITHYKGRYYLYYSVSMFGRNHSVIGLVTNTTLDPADKDYRWEDQGKVVQSRRENDYNAIDPSLVRDSKGRAMLSFGSFWSGIKMMEVDPKTGKPAPDAPLLSIASRPEQAIEAPCLFQRGKYFYNFLSFDLCCRGAASTYNIRVGRATKMEGPYVDKEGRSMMEGGGTMLIQDDGRFAGPGHCSVAKRGNRYYIAYHAYDREANGVPTLRIRPITWDKEGWPTLGEAIEKVDGQVGS